MTLQDAIKTVVTGLQTVTEISTTDQVLIFDANGDIKGRASLRTLISKYGGGYVSYADAGYNEEEVVNLVDEVLEE